MSNDYAGWTEWKISPTELTGVAGIWGCYNALVRQDFSLKAHRWLSTACDYTFFIYLSHVPALLIIKKLIVAVIGKTSAGYMAAYLVSPLLFILAAVPAGMALRKYFGKIYLFCTGGR